MSARCGKCGAPVDEPARCSNGHAQPRDTIDRLAELFGENIDYDVLAEKVVERLHRFIPDLAAAADQTYGTVDVASVARELGMSETWVYRHADELGAERRGNGPKARLRFDLERARAAFSRPVGPSPRSDRPSTPRKRRECGSTELLPVRDRAA